MNDRGTRTAVGLLVGVGLIALGLIFLLAQFLRIDLGAFWPFGVNFWDVIWPFIIIVPGLLFFAGMILGGRSMAALAIPASILTTVGLILLYQNTFDHWESWAYAWALIFPTSLGLGFIIQGAWGNHPATVRSGMTMVQVGLLMFLVAGFFFEVVLNISGNPFVRIIWPLLLIGFGVFLLLRVLLRPYGRAAVGVESDRHEESEMQAPVDTEMRPPREER